MDQFLPAKDHYIFYIVHWIARLPYQGFVLETTNLQDKRDQKLIAEVYGFEDHQTNLDLTCCYKGCQ